ncbi:P-loop containing nucleoside triphosphate hydrolase protein [Dentipellis sp. KUC8613]|nr:P-loop containing nucleoside triphosphate hydrolase protein [Dentipellis sp. KUC8613]
MAPKTRNPNPSGLGRAIINRKAKDARQAHESGLYTTDLDSTSRLKSVTQERDLEEFLSTAQLAGTEFTAERRNIKIIQSSGSASQNAYLLSEQEEKSTLKKHQENKQRLRVPRRPHWTKSMTPAQLDRQEKDAFLEWRRGLAELQERDNFLLTPFERNIEVWRQLWRVLERSHLIVQIVDARNPLRFRCEDLETYIRDIDTADGEQMSTPGKRRSLLLINKADLLTDKQRLAWADYFDKQGIQYAFFSAANAVALQEARREALAAETAATEEEESHPDNSSSASDTDETPPVSEGPAEAGGSHAEAAHEGEDDQDEDDDSVDEDGDDSEWSDEYEVKGNIESTDPRAKVLSVLELEDLFISAAPPLSDFKDGSGNPPTKLVVGLVGYPNVGKSSTINSLLGEKKVSVSSTPGKTKHFQTIHLSDNIVLCDCPGLVFPQFATTRADLVCDGVLPIDQLREYTGPISLVVKRMPKEVLELTYGLVIRSKGLEEGGDGKITAEDLLITYAIARGFTRSGQGNPDEARSARVILKDYVNAKLLFCHPPPGIPEDEFNEETRALSLARAAGKKMGPTSRVPLGALTFVPGSGVPVNDKPGEGQASRVVDKDFFVNNSGLSAHAFMKAAGRPAQEFSRVKLYPHQNAVSDTGVQVGGRRARLAAVLAVANESHPGKKHHKKGKRTKQRGGGGYE